MLTEFNRGAEINVYLRNQRTFPSLFHTVNLLVMLQFLYLFFFCEVLTIMTYICCFNILTEIWQYNNVQYFTWILYKTKQTKHLPDLLTDRSPAK